MQMSGTQWQRNMGHRYGVVAAKRSSWEREVNWVRGRDQGHGFTQPIVYENGSRDVVAICQTSFSMEIDILRPAPVSNCGDSHFGVR